uniref:Activin_recp domain-containing protein n=1 Tax=Elaeophora elaphi TaxID=1147741 RepID=A0A0R3S341_9BILA
YDNKCSLSERRTVQKGCGKKYEENGCRQSIFGSKWTSRCVCNQMMCNYDEALAAVGLETTSGTVANKAFPIIQIFLISLVFALIVSSYSVINIKMVCFIFSIIYASILNKNY